MTEGLGRVLIASGTDKGAAYLKDLLTEFHPESTTVLQSGVEIRRGLSGGVDYDFVFVNMPLLDETGAELVKDIAERGHAFVTVLLREEIADQIGAALLKDGVFVVRKPVVRAHFLDSVQMMMMAWRKVERLQSENDRLRQKLEDVSLVARAKCVLIYHKAIDEYEAHRYIEKRAMDERRSKREIAFEILHEFDDE
ncbi:MAG: ANTAR domain-containing protein [Clostridiales bacterium]|nr:ANTAR domain-containing protein [Clostridiales bacterium]